MKMKVFTICRRSLALTLALALVVGFVFMIPTRAVDTSVLGALIDSFTPNDSVFTLTTSSRFFLAQEPTEEVTNTVQLAQSQFAADELPSAKVLLDIVWGKTNMVRTGDILIKMDPTLTTIGDEGYILEVASYATVTARDVRGLLYGLNMLQKHFRNADSTKIKGFTAYDTPDTKERTVQLDCARKYLSANYICNFVKEMSWMGYNTLQLHFSEDGGYRADLWDENYYVEGHYKPENDFSWLCGSKTQYWTHNSALTGVDYTKDPDENKYLTTAELIEIINTCKEYHIDIIPSFDSPAHMNYLTWKFEQNYTSNPSYSFTYNGTTYHASATSGCINYTGTTGQSIPNGDYTTMDIRDNTTQGKMSQAFVLSIYKDMADFFKYYAGSTKFNIGADEVNLTRTGAWTYDLFPGYINEVNALLNARGYTCRVFNDFIKTDYINQFADNIEILYWNSPYNSVSGKSNSSVPAVSAFVSDNRMLYNCINQHTYYVLRIDENHGDARSKTCYEWEFYGSDEESIYNDWTPNNIRKKGKYTEPDAIVPASYLGGAYFLTWHDYAAVNTEIEIWNGVTDAAKKTGEFYSLRERMWSNTIKMWNWDINDTENGGINFTSFETLRDTLGDFPGLQSDTFDKSLRYAKTTSDSLPNPTEPIQLADRTQLSAALVNKIEQGDYSDKTYEAYEKAYNDAVDVNNNNRATVEELGTALANLNAAINGLKIKTNAFTVDLKTKINGIEYVIKSTKFEIPVNQDTFTLHIPYMKGYNFINAEGASFTLSPSGDGSGYLTCAAVSDATYTLWYENAPDKSRLNDLIAEEIREQGDFTHTSWVAYTTALKNAKNFSTSAETRQEDVDKLVKALEDARTALVVDCDVTTITVEKVSGSFKAGQQVGLFIKTSANIPELTVTNKETGTVQTLDFCSGEVQTLNNGEVVKYWLIFFTVDNANTYTYSVSYRTFSTDISVTVE